jgi:alcohol dehydrogenase class IV
MPKSFEFATAGRIVFGDGAASQLPAIAASFGERPLIVTGKRGCPVEGLHGPAFTVSHEPSIDLVLDGADEFRKFGCDCVVAIGGGSVIDAGKAIAAVAANPGHILDYLEVIGRDQPLENPPHPFIAVPTTAGTGSEVTRNSVLSSPEHRVKVSLRSPLMLPRVALVDPALTLGLPPALTASTGLDALTQLIEPYVCSRANPFVDRICLDGLPRVVRSLERAYSHGHDLDARSDMAYASLLGGLALANAGLGVVHGFAAPIGGMFDAPHGAVCAAILPYGIEANVGALRRSEVNNDALERYSEIARILTGCAGANAEDCVQWVRQLTKTLAIPGLGAFGVQTADIPQITEKAARASSMKANPVELTLADLTRLMEQAL